MLRILKITYDSQIRFSKCPWKGQPHSQDFFPFFKFAASANLKKGKSPGNEVVERGELFCIKAFYNFCQIRFTHTNSWKKLFIFSLSLNNFTGEDDRPKIKAYRRSGTQLHAACSVSKMARGGLGTKRSPR